MKNRPPAEGQSSAPPKGLSVAVMSWFIFPGVGQAALGHRQRGQAWAAVFLVLLALALWPLVSVMGAIYAAATNLKDLPAGMAERLQPVLLWGGIAAVVWLGAGLDAWRLARRP